MRVVQAPVFVAPIPGYSGKLTGTIEGHEPDTWRDVALYVDGETNPQRPRGLTYLRQQKAFGNSWTFLHLQENTTYTVIAWDHTNMFDPVIKVGLIPEPM